jgi:hypothetical protein
MYKQNGEKPKLSDFLIIGTRALGLLMGASRL